MATATPLQMQDAVSQFLATPRKLLIDGRWVAASSGKTFDSIDPATGEVLARVAEGDKADIDAAVKAARRAFENGPWTKMSASERGRIIWKIADLLEEHTEEFAELETLDNGKPISVSRVADVPLAVDLFRYMAGWSTKIEGNTIPIAGPFFAYTRREPIGVVGQIIPWNFPLLMAAWKLGPALATGCTVVLKPAEQTPLSAVRLGELAMEAGLPPGVLNIVTGFGETAGAALAAHPDVDKIAFTGSTEVGKLIVHAAAGNLKKVTLELGGKSPNIVFDDADVNKATAGAANAIFFNHGQCCCAGSRLFVEDKIFDKVVEGVSESAKKIRVGPGMNTDGKKVGNRGYFVEPTVLVNTNPKMKVVQEEIFGPVVTAMPFKSVDEIAAEANNTSYGLAAGIWTKDIGKAHALANKLKAGTVWINCYNVFDAAMPFGGYKQSGWGREMGKEALELYTETKAVCVKIN